MIEVLVVDDSLYMQRRICKMLTRQGDIRIVGRARDGVQAVGLARELEPDVITMDLRMPRMGGVQAIEEIMASNPRPIVIFSSYSDRDGVEGMRGLDLGAVDIVGKPSGSVSLDVDEVSDELVQKVRTAARVRVVRNAAAASRPPAPEALPEPPPSPALPARSDRVAATKAKATGRIVCFASSTGGPGVLASVLEELPQQYPLPIVIAQHMPGKFTRSFSEQLDGKCAVRVKEAEDGELVQPGVVYIAPGFRHLRIREDQRLEILEAKSVSGPAPSADLLFESAADCFGAGVVAIVLSGMGGDGAAGVERVYREGGRTIAQEEASCAVFGMPKAAIETRCVGGVLSVEEIALELRRTASLRRNGGPT